MSSHFHQPGVNMDSTPAPIPDEVSDVPTEADVRRVESILDKARGQFRARYMHYVLRFDKCLRSMERHVAGICDNLSNAPVQRLQKIFQEYDAIDSKVIKEINSLGEFYPDERFVLCLIENAAQARYDSIISTRLVTDVITRFVNPRPSPQ
jgi:hypothetical protein